MKYASNMQRIKFGTRRNGTRWFFPLNARKIRWEEMRDINHRLSVLYPFYVFSKYYNV